MEKMTFRAEALFDPRFDAHYNYITQIRTVTQMHDHDFCELFLVAYGSVVHCVPDTREVLPAGSLVLVRDRDTHAFWPDGDTACGIANLAFSKALLTGALRYLYGEAETSPLWMAQKPPQRRLTQEETGDVLRAFEALNAMPTHAEEQGPLYVRKLVMRLLMNHFCTEQAPARASAVPPWLETLHLQMQAPEHFTKGLPAMHALCGKSLEHMYRQFHRYYGQTPAAYVNGLRIGYAANLLRNTDRDIVDVAMEAGFENLSYFYQLFKRRYGLTPQRYRRETQRSAIVVPEA